MVHYAENILNKYKMLMHSGLGHFIGTCVIKDKTNRISTYLVIAQTNRMDL